jgi:CRISP-associated protein Cas1
MPAKTKPTKRRARNPDTTGDLFERQIPRPCTPPEEASPAAPQRNHLDETIREVLRHELTPASIAPPAPQGETASSEPDGTDWIPARMLNEFVYCPRLYFYEHVEGVFVENADTARGKRLHKRVDAGSGALPPADAEEKIHSCSISLGSQRLGVTAKLDLVESAEGGTVLPVDYKAGAPREGDDGIELWPTDRMQLGLQILLLRDNGYSCQEGVIYYRATKQRVNLPLTTDLEAWILDRIAAARDVARGPIPPPLEASPKCARCSLNPVCLPDETRQLAEEKEEGRTQKKEAVPPRRLIAAREDTRVLYLNTPGLRIGQKEGLLVVKEEKRTLDEIRINDLTHVALFGNIQITTQAVHSLCQTEIPLTYFSMGGWFYGITRGHGLKNVFTRIAQFRAAADPASCLRLARKFVAGKIRNQRTLLMRLHESPPAPAIARLKYLAESTARAESLPGLLGTEGAAAADYFGEFNGMLKAGDDIDMGNGPPPPEFQFEFEGRNRRPPTDPVNALLSLAYSLLAKDCTLAATAVGFDPYVGFYHQPRFGRPALALDVMEEFRPLIAESAVLTCINNGMLHARDFVHAGHAVNLTPEGRKIFFQVYEQRMNSLITHPVFDYKVSYRRVLELQFRLLARFLTGEIPDYPPFLTR